MLKQLTVVMRQPHKMVKHTQTIGRLSQTNCFSVFDYFVGLALKGLMSLKKQESKKISFLSRLW